MKQYSVLVIIFFAMFRLYGQTDSTANTGQIVMGEVIVEKNKEIVLPIRDKQYQRAVLKQFDNEPLNIKLNVQDPDLIWPPYKTNLPFEKVAKTYPESEYQSYIKLGYGNYGSPLGEAGIFERVGAFETATKLFYEHFSSGPVNDKNSGNSLGSIDFSAAYKGKSFELKPRLSFESRQYRFYGNTNRVSTGFDPLVPPKVNSSAFNFDVNLRGKVEDFQYTIQQKITVTQQALRNGAEFNEELVFGAVGGINYQLDKKFLTGFDLEGNTSTYRSSASSDRSLFRLNPWVQYHNQSIKLTGGFNLVTSKSGDLKQSGFYPNFAGEWSFAPKWELQGEASGNVNWQGLNELLSENEFLDDSLQLRNIENTFQVGGGIKGAAGKNIYVDTKLLFTRMNDVPFYTPSPSDSSRFVLSYDDETVSRVSFQSKITFAPTASSSYKASLELNRYSVTSLDRPWHLPSYILRLGTSHNIKEKLIFSTNLIAMGGIRAPAAVDFGIVNLDAFLDAGIDLKYLISERASIWLEVNNLGNNEYERYLGYPIRAINFKIGGQYRF